MSLRGTSPIVPVSDPVASARFYVDVLGFTQVIDNTDAGYALFQKDGALVAVINAADEAALTATRTNISAQIWVESVDRLWEGIKDAVTQLPEDRFTPPHDRHYGVREIHIKDPDGFLIFFTEA